MFPNLPSDFRIFAHRGAKSLEPENTLRAFQRAIDLGARWTEFDVQLSADQRLIVFHDSEVGRVTNGEGRVAEMSLQQLQALDAGQGERIPTLDAVLDCCLPKMGVNIELKGRGTAAPVADLLREYFHRGAIKFEQFLISAFDHRELRVMKRLLPACPLGALFDGRPENIVDSTLSLGAESLNMSYEYLDRELVSEAQHAGLKVYAYTVNSAHNLKRVLAYGVDGIFTDYPQGLPPENAGKS